MAWLILSMTILKALHVLYQLVFTDKEPTARVASVLVIGFEGACAYWLYFASGLFGV